MANIISNIEDFTKKTGDFLYNIANYDYLGLMMNTGYKDIPYVAYGMTGVVLSVFAYVTIKDDGIGETKSTSIIGDESMVGLNALAPPAIFESQPESEPEPPAPPEPEPPAPPEPEKEEEKEELVGGKKRKLSKKRGGQKKMIRKTKKGIIKKNHKKS